MATAGPLGAGRGGGRVVPASALVDAAAVGVDVAGVVLITGRFLLLGGRLVSREGGQPALLGDGRGRGIVGVAVGGGVFGSSSGGSSSAGGAQASSADGGGAAASPHARTRSGTVREDGPGGRGTGLAEDGGLVSGKAQDRRREGTALLGWGVFARG